MPAVGYFKEIQPASFFFATLADLLLKSLCQHKESQPLKSTDPTRCVHTGCISTTNAIASTAPTRERSRGAKKRSEPDKSAKMQLIMGNGRVERVRFVKERRRLLLARRTTGRSEDWSFSSKGDVCSQQSRGYSGSLVMGAGLRAS